MPDINIVKIDGRPLEKLIDTVKSAIGTLYRPTAIRKESLAEADRIVSIAQAEAKATLIQGEADIELFERIKSRLYAEEKQKQLNAEGVVNKTVKYLGETVSETPVDNDWRTRFFSKAQQISNEEMQEVWAKILAEEVSAPGRISLRTLDILSNLTKSEAEIFQRAITFTADNMTILKLHELDLEAYGLSYSGIMELRNAGLFHEGDDLGLTFTMKEGFDHVIFTFGKKIMNVKHPSLKSFTFNQIKLTQAGIELCSILNPEVDEKYFLDLKHYLSTLGYVLEEK